MERSDGLTLVELIVAMGIMAILLAMALPSVAAWRESAAYRDAAREIAGMFRFAAGHAVTRGLETEVDIDLDRPRMRLRQGDRSNGSTTWTVVSDWQPLPAEVRLAVTLGCTKRADGNPATVDHFTYQFNPSGSSSAIGKYFANYLCILDRDDHPRFKLAMVNKVMGRVAIRTP